MAYLVKTRPEDVLGNPRIKRKASQVGDAFVSQGEGLEVAPSAITRMVAEADAELLKVADTCNKGPVATDTLLQKVAAGVPIPGVGALLQRQQQAASNASAQQLYSQALNKLGMAPDLVKEITTGITSGVGGTAIGNWTTDAGPWIYDLEKPSLKTFPVLTPLRNRLPRSRGYGTSFRFRTITGISGSQTGGVANMRISQNEGTTEVFRGVTLNRPKKISYATTTANVLYRIQGVSDDLTWAAQYASQGFEDLRGLIARNLMSAHFMGEEQLLLNGRNSASGGTGALAAPGAPVLTSRAAATGETGLSGGTTSLYVKITSLGHFGESAGSSATTVAYTAGNVVDVTLPSTGLPTGSMGFRAYVSTGAADPGDASRFRVVWGSGAASGQDYSGGNLLTITGALPTSGSTVPTTDTGTGNVDDYDGIIPLTAANGGVSLRLNSTLSIDAIEKQLFYPLWNVNKADPDEIWVQALESIRITDLVLGASGTPYRVTVNVNEEGSITGGYRVSRLMNKVTGKVVDVTVHPYMEQGTLLALSYSLPIPDSEITNPWEVKESQSLISIAWPVIQESFDESTFCYSSLISRATIFSGILQGIQPA